MGKWEFYDEHDEVEIDEQEPSFSFHDFQKWLDSQQQPSSFRESVENRKREENEQDKDSLKKEFKQRMIDKVQKKINKRLAERKNKEQ